MPATVTSPITPKSALRHRMIDPDLPTQTLPLAARASRKTQRPKQSDPIPCWKVEQSSVKPRSHAVDAPHWLVTLGSGMLLTLLLVLVGQVVLGWVSTSADTLRYGYPRTYQTDAFIGHEKTGRPSHFIAMNLQGKIEVIELPGGDETHARIFPGPQLYGPGADLAPVTLRFATAPGSRLPDMYLLFQNTQLVFHNTQGTFIAGP